ncbi:MAG: polyphosphate polymerase domain-containing protein [Methanolinea sp.]|jgi:hypothetical protein|nr:polyphosphate polymerase domain-containing protein [Methanolinea sp.]
MNTIEMNAGNCGIQRDLNDRIAPEAELSSVIRKFESISLSDLEEAKAQLLTRVESKHLMTAAQCSTLISTLADSYRVLVINNTRIGRYETLYYDTSAFLTYLQHHNGKGNRYKLRLRHYESSDETYLEVKKKTNKGSTEKSRIRTCWPTNGFLPEQEEFLKSAFPYDYLGFFPALRTVYDRFTLVSTKSPERITFDTGVAFDNGQKVRSFPGLVIGEIKYEKGVRNSPALSALHAMGIKKRAFSKYCIGVSLLYDWVKRNRFKQNLLFLSKITPGAGIPC